MQIIKCVHEIANVLIKVSAQKGCARARARAHTHTHTHAHTHTHTHTHKHAIFNGEEWKKSNMMSKYMNGENETTTIKSIKYFRKCLAKESNQEAVCSFERNEL